jgi:hypothetical protein
MPWRSRSRPKSEYEAAVRSPVTAPMPDGLHRQTREPWAPSQPRQRFDVCQLPGASTNSQSRPRAAFREGRLTALRQVLPSSCSTPCRSRSGGCRQRLTGALPQRPPPEARARVNLAAANTTSWMFSPGTPVGPVHSQPRIPDLPSPGRTASKLAMPTTRTQPAAGRAQSKNLAKNNTSPTVPAPSRRSALAVVRPEH